MTRFCFYFLLLITLLCLIGVTGCGRGNRPADLPKLTPCQLTFQYEDGSPVDNAIVMLTPAEGKWYNNGKTDSRGLVEVLVNGEFPGAVQGEYKVTVRKTELIYPPGWNPDGDNENLPEPETILYVDEKFGSLHTTPLTLTVTSTPVKETFTVSKPKTQRKR